MLQEKKTGPMKISEKKIENLNSKRQPVPHENPRGFFLERVNLFFFFLRFLMENF